MRIAAWLLAAGPALWAVARLGGLDRVHPLVAAISFTPHVAAASVVVLVAVAAMRQRVPLAVAAAATLALGVAVIPRSAGSPEADGPHLRVLTVNAAVGAVPAEAIADLVREHRVDLLSVQELTPDLDAELRDVLPHAVTRPEAGATGTGLYSLHPLREIDAPVGGPFAQTAARLQWREDFDVVSVHPPPPVSAQHVDGWHETFDGLPRADRPRILAGDFNATLDHHALRELIGSGFTDAADATGDGLRATWPANRGGLRPGIAIDHVLVTQDLVAVRTEIVGLPRGDHRAVFAELVARASTG
jgi:endonuclease/exonuclease/phosphatase (EEP) superfamily protein YafD